MTPAYLQAVLVAMPAMLGLLHLVCIDSVLILRSSFLACAFHRPDKSPPLPPLYQVISHHIQVFEPLALLNEVDRVSRVLEFMP